MTFSWCWFRPCEIDSHPHTLQLQFCKSRFSDSGAMCHVAAQIRIGEVVFGMHRRWQKILSRGYQPCCFPGGHRWVQCVEIHGTRQQLVGVRLCHHICIYHACSLKRARTATHPLKLHRVCDATGWRHQKTSRDIDAGKGPDKRQLFATWSIYRILIYSRHWWPLAVVPVCL